MCIFNHKPVLTAVKMCFIGTIHQLSMADTIGKNKFVKQPQTNGLWKHRKEHTLFMVDPKNEPKTTLHFSDRFEENELNLYDLYAAEWLTS